MTAVAEGASIFAESIDWSSANHNRKATNEEVKTNIDLTQINGLAQNLTGSLTLAKQKASLSSSA